MTVKVAEVASLSLSLPELRRGPLRFIRDFPIYAIIFVY